MLQILTFLPVTVVMVDICCCNLVIAVSHLCLLTWMEVDPSRDKLL